MILQALVDYYDRKAADPDSGIAPLGWEWKEIPYMAIFDHRGCFIRLEVSNKRFLVPSLGESRGGGKKANLFWDNAEYLFGIPVDYVKIATKEKKYLKDVFDRHSVFVKRMASLVKVLGHVPEYVAALSFVKSLSPSSIMADPAWETAKKPGINFILCVRDAAGSIMPISDIPEVRQKALMSSGTKGIRCLVTGEIDELKVLEPPIKGILGGNKAEYHIVAVNNKVESAGNVGKTPAFASFMKEKGENSPIGKKASFAYTTALNMLLAKDSRQKMSVGDATAVFWSEKKTALEDEFVDLFGEPAKDDPDRGVAAVERLLASVKTGSFSHESASTRFYVLGLAPNSARISVRFWHSGTVADMERRFADWFENLRIAHSPREKEHLSLWRLLMSIAPLGKSENIPPNLAGAVMRSILEGSPYPATLLSSALVRIKAEREVSYPRAKLVKAFLNHNKERKLTVSLDRENTNVGYRLGRLFAVLEKIQEEANPGINATIRDKFYAAASSTPTTVFGNLMRLKNHHLGKLSQGRAICFEKLLGEVIAKIPSFPPHLSLDSQGEFAIGYYHQRQDFFTKKESVEKQQEETV